MKETKFIYFPLYLSDYVSEARKMTMIQRGAFTDLACLYFQENLKLPYTKQLIYRMVFAFEKEEQAAVDFILQNYFKETQEEPMGLIWVSDSLDLIGCKVLKRLDANRENGKLGGRGNKKDNKPMGSELGNPNHNPDESILNESKLNEIKLNKNPKGFTRPTLGEIKSDFEKFWSDYTPIKVSDGKVVSKGSRKTAKIAYERARKTHSAEKIYEGAANYLVNCYENNRLSCQAVVFLNQERFLDDYQQTNLEVKKHV
jgi:uncharacterized protein YdaU (DUF1376 family)